MLVKISAYSSVTLSLDKIQESQENSIFRIVFKTNEKSLEKKLSNVQLQLNHFYILHRLSCLIRNESSQILKFQSKLSGPITHLLNMFCLNPPMKKKY